ncbi:uncharacterized protein BX664DRAFT_361011 [Halteromyces radiatus]|uniref:uncharacterized protein n=1 Tax=Halteromyces radiatus TaxID=101107 RepID=UPI00221EADB5|nr:uncharacterized protein BX664DRAFT_361011 [Halteromyces radiatus]KAI8082707.1 hypothetical protein BX664DRAFT_361011 [Halteromyces radiatus]
MVVPLASISTSSTSSTGSPTLDFYHSPEPALSFMVKKIDGLLDCSSKPSHHHRLPSLQSFVRQVYVKCRLSPSILVIALIYIHRLQQQLPLDSKGDYDTPHKVFLAAVLLACKYNEDSKSLAQAIYRCVSVVYTNLDLNEMERSFLGVVKFDLFVDMKQVTRFIEEHPTLELNWED